MAKYLIESPHTQEECLQALDDTLALGSDTLKKFYFGCNVGDHTAYAVVDAPNETAAKNMVPLIVRSKAKVVEVSQYTPEQIRSFHRAA